MKPITRADHEIKTYGTSCFVHVGKKKIVTCLDGISSV